ncbi:hypothetical protein N7499_012321 [Penicillium canescens]|nr:hypothetical protein N7499_012321 [Penicillium canescens]KAJ6154862.1 hypothetical protein N7485_013231 [Penicillium canescens]
MNDTLPVGSPTIPAASPTLSESSHGSSPMSISSGSSFVPAPLAPVSSPVAPVPSPITPVPSPVPSQFFTGSGPMSISSGSSFVPAPAVPSDISAPNLPLSDDYYFICHLLATHPRTLAHAESAARVASQSATVHPPRTVTPPLQKNPNPVTPDNGPFNWNNVMSEDSPDMEPSQPLLWQDTPPRNPPMSATDPIFHGRIFETAEDRIQASEDLLLAEMAKNHNDPPHHFTNDDEMSYFSIADLDAEFHGMETGEKLAPKHKPNTPIERSAKRVKNNNTLSAMTESASTAAFSSNTKQTDVIPAMPEPATTESTPKPSRRRRKTRKSFTPEVTRTLRSSTTKKTEESVAKQTPKSETATTADAEVPSPSPNKSLPESWATALDEDKLVSMMKDQGYTWVDITEMWAANSTLAYSQASLKKRWGNMKKKLGRWTGFDEALVAVVEIVRSDLNEILTDESWEQIAATISVELNLAVTGEFCKGRFVAIEDEKLTCQG